MTELIEEIEVQPVAWPPAPEGLFSPATHQGATMPLEPSVIWSRIEAYISHRWTVRDVAWVVLGPGEWVPPLTPAIVSAVDAWQDHAWQSVTLNPSPLGGYVLTGDGPYRFTASVGGGTVPEVVNQAFRRLHDYLGESPGRRVYSMQERSLADAMSRQEEMPELNLARALQLSGAADLLRPYRRMK